MPIPAQLSGQLVQLAVTQTPGQVRSCRSVVFEADVNVATSQHQL